MCLLLESIRYQDGRFHLLEYHLERMRSSCEKLNLPIPTDLQKHLTPPTGLQKGRWKVRVLYDSEIKNVEWLPYQKAQTKRVLLIAKNSLNYSLKLANRSFFEGLKTNHPNFDDFIIVKNNQITDGTYSNILVKLNGRWFTPSHPLLKGVQRQFLLNSGLIHPIPISPEILLNQAEQIKLINAMMPMEDCIDLVTENIYIDEKVR